MSDDFQPPGSPGDGDMARNRRRRLLNSYYGGGNDSTESKSVEENSLDSPQCDLDGCMAKILEKKRISELLDHNQTLREEMKQYDAELQRLVYENYNKFISATITIRKMKDHVDGMEEEMGRLMKNMEDISSLSDAINTNLEPKREKIEQLSGVSRSLKKIQFILDLPSRLTKAIELKAYTQAVKYYSIASTILKQYKHMASFQQIQKESEQVMDGLRILLRKLMSDPSAHHHQVEESVRLLLQLGEPVEKLRTDFVSTRSAILTERLTSFKPQFSISPIIASPATPISGAGSAAASPPTEIGSTSTSPAGGDFKPLSANIQRLVSSFLPEYMQFWKVYQDLFARVSGALTPAGSTAPLGGGRRDPARALDQIAGGGSGGGGTKQRGKSTKGGDRELAAAAAAALLAGKRDDESVAYLREFLECTRDLFVKFFAVARTVLMPTEFSTSTTSTSSPKPESSLKTTGNLRIENEDLKTALDILHSEVQTVHHTLPEANLMEKLANVLTDSVKFVLQYNTQSLQTALENHVNLMSKYVFGDRKSKHASAPKSYVKPDTPTGVEPPESSLDDQKRSELFDLPTNLAIAFGDEFEATLLKMQPIIQFNNPVLSSNLSMFIARVNICAKDVFEGLIDRVKLIGVKSTEKDKGSDVLTSVGFLLMAKFYQTVATKCVVQVSNMLKKKYPVDKSKGNFFDVDDISKRMEDAAKRLLLTYVETQGGNLANMIRKGVETPNWLRMKEPRDVRLVIDLVVDEVAFLNDECSALFPDERARRHSSSSLGSEKSNRSTSTRDSHLSRKTATTVGGQSQSTSRREKERMAITKDMDRLFNKHTKFTIVAPRFAKSSILAAVIKIAIKTFVECVRLRTFGRSGFQQMQVDMHFLRLMWQDLVACEDERFLDVIDEVLVSTADRCVEPTFLDQSIIDSICEAKISRMH